MTEYTKPFKVVICADVSSTEDYEYAPSKCPDERWSMEDAVGRALDRFRMENDSKTIKIHSVTVTRNESE